MARHKNIPDFWFSPKRKRPVTCRLCGERRCDCDAADAPATAYDELATVASPNLDRAQLRRLADSAGEP